MKYISLLFLFAISINSFTQTKEVPKMKYGSQIEEDFERDFSNLIDEEDNAIRIFENGKYEFYFNSDYISQRREYHTRIKILKSEGKEVGDIRIKFNDDYQDVINIKGVTYNLENGKVEKYKLKKSDILRSSKGTDGYRLVSFAIPNLQEGSIFEYTYTISTKNHFSVPKWYFDDEMPTYYSQLNFFIPDFIKYNYSTTTTLDINEEKPKAINLKDGSIIGVQKILGKFGVAHYNEEDYVANINDFRPQAKFVLTEYKLGSRIVYIDNSWENISNEMLNEHYDVYLKKDNKSEKLLAEILGPVSSDLEKLKTIFDYVNANYTLEEEGWIYPNENFSSLVKSKKGNTTDINLLLTKLLKIAGLDAEPLLVSKRNEGYINMYHPDKSEFTYAVCLVTIDNKQLILNASASETPYYLADYEDYNFQGWVVSKTQPRWLDIETLAPKSLRIFSINAKLLQNGTLTGTLTAKFKNYLKQIALDKVKEDSFEVYLNDLYQNDETSGELTLNNSEIIGNNNKYKDLTFTSDFTIENAAESINEYLYFNPYLFEGTTKNPFYEEDRNYPIDFRFPFVTKVVFTIELPEGYTVEELPESTSLKISKDVNLKYIIKHQENELLANITEKMYQTIFSPSDYKTMKNYHEKLVEISGNQIVLKKN